MKTRTSGQGRPKGIPNKVTKDVREMVRAALKKAGGESYLVRQAKANPKAFMTLVAKLIPQRSELSGPEGGDLPVGVTFYMPDNQRGDVDR